MRDWEHARGCEPGRALEQSLCGGCACVDVHTCVDGMGVPTYLLSDHKLTPKHIKSDYTDSGIDD